MTEPTRVDTGLRPRIEAGFGRWGHTVARHRFLVIGLMLLLTLCLGSQLKKVRFDTSQESMFQKDDPTLIAYNDFRSQFGREDLIFVAIGTQNLFSETTLDRLATLHRELEEQVPYVDEVTSLINVRSTRGEDGELIVGDLMEEWPESNAERSALRDRVMSTRSYLDRLISRDGKVTTIAVRLNSFTEVGDEIDPLAAFDASGFGDDEGAATDGEQEAPQYISGEELAEAVIATVEVIGRHQQDDFEIHVAGGPILSVRIMHDMMKNMRTFVGLGLVTIGALLLVLFRRLSGLLLPLLVVVFSLISTFGIQAMRGTPAGAPTQIVPSFLLAVGVGAAVHILVIFYREFDAGASKEDALSITLGHSGLAVVMTGLTTAGGLLSFNTAAAAPVADLGVLAPVGILFGLLYCLVLLPALIVALPIRRKKTKADAEHSQWISRVLVATGDRAVRDPFPILLITALLMIVALLGAVQIRFHHDTLIWFPEDDAIRIDTEWIDSRLAGTMALEVIIDSGQENGFHDPERLAALDRLIDKVMAMTGGEGLEVRKTNSIGDVVKEINQALNDNSASAYTIPENRELIAQELLLFENSGSDDLEDFVDSQFRIARFTLQLPYVPPANYPDFIPQVEEAFQVEFGDGTEIQTTGFMRLMADSVAAIADSMFTSYALALAIITPMMMLLIGTLRGGLVSMVPNLAPIILVLGVMGWGGIDFDLFTLLIGSIAIGLAVDDTIHFMHNFYRYYRETGNTRSSVRRTLETTGVAMLVTSIVLTCGFFTYLFSEMENLFYFGALTGMAIILAFVADVLVSPALVSVVTGGYRREESR